MNDKVRAEAHAKAPKPEAHKEIEERHDIEEELQRRIALMKTAEEDLILGEQYLEKGNIAMGEFLIVRAYDIYPDKTEDGLAVSMNEHDVAARINTARAKLAEIEGQTPE